MTSGFDIWTEKRRPTTDSAVLAHRARYNLPPDASLDEAGAAAEILMANIETMPAGIELVLGTPLRDIQKSYYSAIGRAIVPGMRPRDRVEELQSLAIALMNP